MKGNFGFKKVIIFFIIISFMGTNLIQIIGAIESSDNILNASLCSDWPKFHYDDMNRGFSWATGSAPNNIAWSNKISNHIWFSSPIIANNKLYIGAQDGLYCLDVSNGNVLWHFFTMDIWSTPMYDDGKIYFGTQGDNFYCLDAETGDQIWCEWHSEDLDTSPNMYNGNIYYGENNGALHCKDAELGYPHWSYVTGDLIRSSPAIYSYAIYFGSKDNKFYCVNADSGDLEWDFTTGGDIFSSPSMCYGNVYFGSDDHKLYCLNADYGNLIWEYETNEEIYSSPSVEFGRVYFGCKDWNFYCLDAYTGELIWNYGTGFPIYSSPGIADDRVYFGSDDHKIYCFDADPSDGVDEGINDVNGASYDLIWTYETADKVSSSPAIVDNKMFIASEDGTVYCFGQGSQNQAPVADFFWLPSEPHAGYTICFDASYSYDPDGTIESYVWDFDNDGQYDDRTGKDVSYTFENAGDYPVSLKITDDDGAIDTITQTVTVTEYSQQPVADFSWSPSNPTEGQMITFDGSDSYDSDGTIVSYDWDFDNDGFFDDGSGVIDTYSFSSSGNHIVSLRVTDNNGLTDIKTDTVYVSDGGGNNPPVADFSWTPNQPNEGDTVTFDASGSYDSDGTIVSYVWDFDDDGQFDDGTGITSTYSWSNEGNYPVSLKITDNEGAVDTQTKIVSVGNVNQPPVADFTFNPDPGNVDEPINFDASSSYDSDGSIVSYSWSFGDGNTGSGIHTTHTYVYSGDFDVTLTVTDNDGLSDSKTKTISIGSEENIPPTVDISFPDNNEEVSDTITISGTASDQDGSINFVQVKIDSESWQTVSGTYYWSMSWDTTLYSNGNHALSARSFDGEDYSSTDTIIVNVQNGGNQDSAELPVLNIGDIWNYNIPDLRLDYGDDIYADGEIDNLQVEVTAKNSNYYTLEGNGEFSGSAQILVEIGDSEVPIPLNNIEQEFNGEITLDVNTLGIKEVEGTVEIPFDFLGSSYKIVIVVTLSSDNSYDYLDFPITEGETWTVGYQSFEYITKITLYKWKIIGQYWNKLYEKQIDSVLPFDEHTCTCTQVQNGEFKIESTIDDSLYYWYSTSEKAIVESVGFLNFFSGFITIDFEMILSGCPPNKPNTPIGKDKPKAGETCQYSTSTVDPNGDLIQYGWDWDGNKQVDEWSEFFESGETCVISHVWTNEELDGKNIFVKARDINSEESPWSDPLELNAERYKSNNVRLFDIVKRIISNFRYYSIFIQVLEKCTINYINN